jgi:hypothetical protein
MADRVVYEIAGGRDTVFWGLDTKRAYHSLFCYLCSLNQHDESHISILDQRSQVRRELMILSIYGLVRL